MVSDRSNAERLGVYVSVPFCRAKCSFCNFASGLGRPQDIATYVLRLCEEIAAVSVAARHLGAYLPKAVDTIYFGGGTPSLLSVKQLEEVFAALRAQFLISDNAEITMEAAPGQITDDLLRAAMRCGVNRVSLGVQSFVDVECSAVGRYHTGNDCIAEVRRLRAAGIAEVGIDLIAGLPHQTFESWEHSLCIATQLAAEGSLTHVSVYMFEVDENSRLGKEVLGGGARMYAPQVPGEENVAAMYERGCLMLADAGFARYELSNFAWVKGCEDARTHESRHNRKYWEREPYIGFGLDAHSMLRSAKGDVRLANPDTLDAYGLRDAEAHWVQPDEVREEEVFLGLRLSNGVPRRVVEGADMDALITGGLLVTDGDRIRLTTHGMMVSNEVFGRLLESVDVAC